MGTPFRFDLFCQSYNISNKKYLKMFWDTTQCFQELGPPRAARKLRIDTWLDFEK